MTDPQHTSIWMGRNWTPSRDDIACAATLELALRLPLLHGRILVAHWRTDACATALSAASVAHCNLTPAFFADHINAVGVGCRGKNVRGAVCTSRKIRGLCLTRTACKHPRRGARSSTRRPEVAWPGIWTLDRGDCARRRSSRLPVTEYPSPILTTRVGMTRSCRHGLDYFDCARVYPTRIMA